MTLAKYHPDPKSQLTAFDHIPQGQLRVIDVACGTGIMLIALGERGLSYSS
jgi:ribosomal protein L11 methylase PrmA